MAEQTGQPNNIAVDEIELGELLRSVRQNWPLIAMSVILALVIALFYLHVATYRYAVTLQVTAANGNSGSGISGQLGSLANLAGVNLPTSPAQVPFELYLEGLKSRQVAETLAREPTLMRHVFASEWDEEHQRWVAPAGMIDGIKRAAQTFIGQPQRPWSPPDAARLHLFLSKNIEIIRDKESPIVTVSFLTPDSRFGQTLLTALHTEVDGMLRRRTLARASAYVSYLRNQLRFTDVADYREALLSALSEQEKMRMMASSTLPFAAEPFGTPIASLKPVTPNPIFVIALAAFAGLGLGAMLVLIRHWTNREQSMTKAD